MRALAFYQCGSEPNRRPGAMCELSLLLVLVLFQMVFQPGCPAVSFLHKNEYSKFQFDLDERTLYEEFLRTLACYPGK